MVSASTNKSVDVSKGVLSFGSHLGENLKNLLANQDVGAALVNSFKYAILLTIVSMVICPWQDMDLKFIMIKQKMP